MVADFSKNRFTIPIDSAQPKGAGRFEIWAPKLQRRLTLFDPFHVQLCAYFESNPSISTYCERPAYWHHNKIMQLTDFWLMAGHREMCVVTTAEPLPVHAGILSESENIAVRYIHQASLGLRAIWIENWMRILPYLSSNARFVSNQLLADITRALSGESLQTLGQLECDFQPNDIVLVRTAVFLLLHKGMIKSDALYVQPLSSEITLKWAMP